MNAFPTRAPAPGAEASPRTARRRERRSILLVQPGLQLRLIGTFAALTALSLLAQYLLFASRLSTLAAVAPGGTLGPDPSLEDLLRDVLLLSFGILLPVTLLIGIHSTFRLAGPLYRFQRHLRAVADGEDVGPCRIRKGDEMQELCGLINAALERARRDGERAGSAGGLAREEERTAA